MIEFLRVQYALERVTAEQLQCLIDSVITHEQYHEITGK